MGDYNSAAISVGADEDLLGWSKEDLNILIDRIQSVTPSTDYVSSKYRANKIDWEQIAFKNYSSTDCKIIWMNLQASIRSRRSLSELLGDVKSVIKSKSYLANSFKRSHEFESQMHESDYEPCSRKKRQKLDLYHTESGATETLPQSGLDGVEKDSPSQSCQKLCINSSKDLKRRRKAAKFIFEHKSVKAPFDLYLESQIRNNDSLDPKEKLDFMRSCKMNWDSMDDEKKYFWINWSEELFIKYKKERCSKEMNLKIGSLLTQNERQIRKKYQNTSMLSLYGGFWLFVKKMMENESLRSLKLHRTDLLEFVTLQWQYLDENEKQQFGVYLDNAKKRDRKQLRKYIDKLDSADKLFEVNRYNQSVIDSLRSHTTQASRKSPTPLSEPTPPESTLKEYYLNLSKNTINAASFEELDEDDKFDYDQFWIEKKRIYIVKYEAYLKTLSKSELEEHAIKILTS